MAIPQTALFLCQTVDLIELITKQTRSVSIVQHIECFYILNVVSVHFVAYRIWKWTVTHSGSFVTFYKEIPFISFVSFLYTQPLPKTRSILKERIAPIGENYFFLRQISINRRQGSTFLEELYPFQFGRFHRV